MYSLHAQSQTNQAAFCWIAITLVWRVCCVRSSLYRLVVELTTANTSIVFCASVCVCGDRVHQIDWVDDNSLQICFNLATLTDGTLRRQNVSCRLIIAKHPTICTAILWVSRVGSTNGWRTKSWRECLQQNFNGRIFLLGTVWEGARRAGWGRMCVCMWKSIFLHTCRHVSSLSDGIQLGSIGWSWAKRWSIVGHTVSQEMCASIWIVYNYIAILGQDVSIEFYAFSRWSLSVCVTWKKETNLY